MATPSSSETYCGSSYGQSNDIQTNYEVMNSFKQNDIQLLESSISKDVMPLLYSTNENCQVYHPDIAQAGKVGPVFSDVASHSPGTPESILESRCLTCMGTLIFNSVCITFMVVPFVQCSSWRSKKNMFVLFVYLRSK